MSHAHSARHRCSIINSRRLRWKRLVLGCSLSFALTKCVPRPTVCQSSFRSGVTLAPDPFRFSADVIESHTKQMPTQVRNLSGQHKLQPKGARVGTRVVNRTNVRRHSAARGAKMELMCHHYTANLPNHKFSILESEKQKRR
jgi:hypothetical protein